MYKRKKYRELSNRHSPNIRIHNYNEDLKQLTTKETKLIFNFNCIKLRMVKFVKHIKQNNYEF